MSDWRRDGSCSVESRHIGRRHRRRDFRQLPTASSCSCDNLPRPGPAATVQAAGGPGGDGITDVVCSYYGTNSSFYGLYLVTTYPSLAAARAAWSQGAGMSLAGIGGADDARTGGLICQPDHGDGEGWRSWSLITDVALEGYRIDQVSYSQNYPSDPDTLQTKTGLPER